MGEGEKVPEFELQDADGNLVRSSDLAGRRYVIYFYPRDFTPGCTREADEFVRDYDSFREAEIEGDRNKSRRCQITQEVL